MSGSDPTGYSWLSDMVSDDDTPTWAIGVAIVAVSAWAIASQYGGGGGGDAAVGAGIGGSATSVGGSSIGIAHAGYGFANAPSGSNPAPTGEFGSGAMWSQGGLYNEGVIAPPGEHDTRMASSEVWAVHTLGTDYREHVTTTEEALAVALVNAALVARQAVPVIASTLIRRAVLRELARQGTKPTLGAFVGPQMAKTVQKRSEWPRGTVGADD